MVSLENCRILIVDDHALLRHMVTNALKPLGMQQPDWALDGDEAIVKIMSARAQGAPYDVVFLDWNMPRMSGIDVLRACRKDTSLDGMAIIMLTAEAEPDNIVRAIEAGATAYITKPFQTELLISKLQDVIAWRDKQPDRVG